MRRASAVGALLVALLATAASAHPLAPALVELREGPEGRARVRVKTSVLLPAGMQVEVGLARCRPLAPARATLEEDALLREWSVACGPGGLAGERVTLAGLGASGTQALVRAELADGRVVRRLLHGDAPDWVVPGQPSRARVLGDHFALGARHLAGGLDHLVFLAGLVLLVRSGRPLLHAVTAFTLGHSVTLALAVLGFVRVPSGPVELAIAGSLLWLALELAGESPGFACGVGPLARERRKPPGPVARRPGALTAGFGLLHGLGFAGALSEAGLPAGEIPLALLGFNAGIELAQLAFVAALLALAPLAGVLRLTSRQLPAHALGALGTCLCLERATLLLRAAW